MKPYNKGDLSSVFGENKKEKDTEEKATIAFATAPAVVLPKVKVDKKEGRKRKERNRDNDANANKRKKKVKVVDDEEKTKRTIFIGNVPRDFDLKEIKKLCRTFGEVESCRMRSVGIASHRPKKVAVALKEFTEDADTANVYVVFKQEESVKKSMILNGQKIGGRIVRVDAAAGGGEFDGPCCIFLGDLPFKCADDDLISALSLFGKVERVRIVRDKQTGVGKGVGFAKFMRPREARRAIKAKTTDVFGRKVRIQRLKKDEEVEKAKEEHKAHEHKKKSFTGQYASTSRVPRGVANKHKKDKKKGSGPQQAGMKKMGAAPGKGIEKSRKVRDDRKTPSRVSENEGEKKDKPQKDRRTGETDIKNFTEKGKGGKNERGAKDETRQDNNRKKTALAKAGVESKEKKEKKEKKDKKEKREKKDKKEKKEKKEKNVKK